MESNFDKKDSEFDSFNWILVLLIFSGIFSSNNNNSELEKEIAELKGKISIIERVI